MKRIIYSALGFVAMTTVATAEPKKLGDAEMAGVTGGLYDFVFIVPITVVVSNTNAAAIGAGSGDAAANAVSNVLVNNIIGVDQSNQVIGAVLPVQPTRPGASGAPAGWWPWADPRPGQASLGLDPLRSALMLSGMLQSRYLGPGW